MSIRNKLREFILANFMVDPETQKFSDTDSLLKKGIIDSMGVMELVAFVQREHSFRVDPEDILPENFDSLDSLESYIRRKTGKAEA